MEDNFEQTQIEMIEKMISDKNWETRSGMFAELHDFCRKTPERKSQGMIFSHFAPRWKDFLQENHVAV